MTADGSVAFRLMRVLSHALARTPLRGVLASEAVARAKFAAGRQMPPSTVVTVVQALRDAGISCWLAGGWGVDALVGEQTRAHGDLDVVVDRDLPNVETRVEAALASIGLLRAGSESSIEPLPRTWVHTDGRGTTVEVLPANLAAPPFNGPTSFQEGRVAGAPVPCVSVEVQLRLRSGYRHRARDRRDITLMSRLRTPDLE
jgi:lincosamide nucleotidyltransferase A/C/D/E